MHTCNPKHHFYSSSIVAGCVAIAAGVALALKMKKSRQKVWVFCGDGCTDEGWFFEAFKYAYRNNLPVTYIIEDNNRSVAATKYQRWGNSHSKGKIIKYEYECSWPHTGCGEWVTF